MEQILVAQMRLNDGGATKQDLLANILEAATGSEDTDDIADSVFDMSITLLFAGYYTTSITLSYDIYLLAKNPAVQETCLEEIESVLGNGDQPECLSSYDALPYTKAVVLESLRLHAPAPLGFRVLNKEIILHDRRLPKGTRVPLPIHFIQTHEMNFPSPMEMRLDRWVRFNDTAGSGSNWEERPSDDSESSDIASVSQDAFLAFSSGARDCPGKHFALREAVTLLAFTIRRVKFELVKDSYEVIPKVKVLQEPNNHLPMTIRRR
jgi:cytochrome P450